MPKLTTWTRYWLTVSIWWISVALHRVKLSLTLFLNPYLRLLFFLKSPAFTKPRSEFHNMTLNTLMIEKKNWKNTIWSGIQLFVIFWNRNIYIWFSDWGKNTNYPSRVCTALGAPDIPWFLVDWGVVSPSVVGVVFLRSIQRHRWPQPNYFDLCHHQPILSSEENFAVCSGSV